MRAYVNFSHTPLTQNTQNQEASPHFSRNAFAEMLGNGSMNLWRIPTKPKIASGVIERVLPFLDHGGN